MAAWRRTRDQAREKYLEIMRKAAAEYDSEFGHQFFGSEANALLSDITQIVDLNRRLSVLEVGAGTGVFTKLLAAQKNLTITALEPSSDMLSKLREKLPEISTIEGWTDGSEDISHFTDKPPFDMIVARLVTTGLYDPVQAFKNWHSWLKPNGEVLLVDGLFPREAWGDGTWAGIVDDLPLGGSTSLATEPYLLEMAGFQVKHTQFTEESNIESLRCVMKPGNSTTAYYHFLILARKQS